MVGDVLIYAVMDFKKLSIPEYSNTVTSILREIRGIGNFKFDDDIDDIYTIEVDLRVAKKVIDLLKNNKSILRYTYTKVIEGSYSVFIIANIDDFLTSTQKNKIKLELTYSIYNMLSDRKFEIEEILQLKGYVRSKYNSPIINEYTGGAGLLLIECYTENVKDILNVIKIYKPLDVGTIIL